MRFTKAKLGLVVVSFVLCLSMLSMTANNVSAASPFTLQLKTVTEGFSLPVNVANAGDGSGRLFVVEKAGRIIVVQNGQKVATPFLDIVPLVRSTDYERGLLSVAFDPKYKDNGYFYVYYTTLNGDIKIARYKVSDNATVADVNSGKVLLSIEHQQYPNHNGGLLMFGPDGYLYAGVGDGGGGGNPLETGQNPKSLLGKLLRIDVDNGDPYAIPKDNPFADGTSGSPEVYDYGLRNPWRYSFDRLTGDLYIGDVGQDRYEEIDVQKKGTPGGLNFGWNVTEGMHCYNADTCDQSNKVMPVAEYSHQYGCAVVGGFVYRGKLFPNMQGYYFFTDECTGNFWSLQETQRGAWDMQLLFQFKGTISSFGQDENGEVYAVDLSSGTLYQLVDASAA